MIIRGTELRVNPLYILQHLLRKSVQRREFPFRIAGPMMSVMYALSGSDTAVVLGIAQVKYKSINKQRTHFEIVVGVLALGLSLAFFFFKLGPK